MSMPFRLRYALASFPLVTDVLFKNYKAVCIAVYDLIIFALEITMNPLLTT